MSAEAAANPTVTATEEQKVVDAPVAVETKPIDEIKPAEPAVEAAAVTTDAPADVADGNTADAPATEPAPAAAAEPVKEEAGRKSPSFFPKKLLAIFKQGDRKPKHKKEKKEEKVEDKKEEKNGDKPEEAYVAATDSAEPAAGGAAAEPAATVDVAPAPVAPAADEAVATEPIKETETAPAPAADVVAPTSPVTEEPIATPRARPHQSPAKIARRLSARVTELFHRKERSPGPVEANKDKVEENPPQIEEPAKVEPLDTSAPTTTDTAPAKADEEAKHAEVPAATPVVAAAA